ncbi:MAG: SDR family NAD(P)-dependent oxidoreductase [Lactobacillus sp.]
MSDSLRDKTVVITGATSGMGKAIALQSAQRGAELILLARREGKLAEVAKEAHSLSGSAVDYLPTDLSKSDQIAAAVKKIKTLTDHVDVLVNAAGFGRFENFLTAKMQETTDMFQVNVLGLMYLTRLIGKMMLEQKAGQIINFGSIAGKIPTTKSAAYSASKAAVIQFSNVLRLELKPFGVHVMTVNPGPVYTNFFNVADPSGKYLQKVQRFVLDPDDVAWEVVHYFGTSRRELNFPLSLAALAKLYALFPTIGDWASLTFASRK